MLLILITTTWILYALVGPQFITALYDSKGSWLAARIMAGRAVVPIEMYFERAEEVLLQLTLYLVAGYVALRLFHKSRELLVFSFSLLLSTFLLFCFFEAFPSLIKIFHLNQVSPYYAYKVSYVPDAKLIFRERPFNRSVTHGFRGSHYSPRYRIEVVPVTIDWTMDRDGFRNRRTPDSADIVVLGDSYLEYGESEADTFTGRLEGKLGGMTVMNLGKSGYGPFQYLEVLKRFGLKYKPKYVLLAFYEGNDIREVRNYLFWKSDKRAELDGLYTVSEDSLWRRYGAAATTSAAGLIRTAKAWRELLLDRIAQVRGYRPGIHPDLAVLNLKGRDYPKLFIDKFSKTTTEEMLSTTEFSAIKTIFADFRTLCDENGITPMILYVPTAAHIYARHSTATSGWNWLRMRDEQIAASDHTENAVKRLARESNIDFISLSPVFRLAAKNGKMVYYPLDAHWNSQGIDIASQFVADLLKSDYETISK